MGTGSAAGLSSRSGLYAHRASALSALESSRFAETAKDSQRNDPALWWGGDRIRLGSYAPTVLLLCVTGWWALEAGLRPMRHLLAPTAAGSV
jgi:hypothetical protein